MKISWAKLLFDISTCKHLTGSLID